MKKHAILSGVVAFAIGAGAFVFAEKPKKDDKPEAKPVNKTCPVEKGHDIDPKVTYKHGDTVVAFCCADCIDEFKKDPEKYMKGLKPKKDKDK